MSYQTPRRSYNTLNNLNTRMKTIDELEISSYKHFPPLQVCALSYPSSWPSRITINIIKNTFSLDPATFLLLQMTALDGIHT